MTRGLLSRAESRRYLADREDEFARGKDAEAAHETNRDRRRCLAGRAAIARADAANHRAAADAYDRMAKGEEG